MYAETLLRVHGHEPTGVTGQNTQHPASVLLLSPHQLLTSSCIDYKFQLYLGFLELAVDCVDLGHNMGQATLEQLHAIVEFAERLKAGARVEMWLRERQSKGLDAQHLELPPEGYTGRHPV